MIPAFNYEPEAEIPQQATFWLPTEDDIPDDEGIGGFRGVWMILNEPPEFTRRVVQKEIEYISLVDRVATTVDEYELAATVIENGEFGTGVPDHLLSRIRDGAPELLELAEDDEYPLQGLELGVAGVSYSLSTIGAVPVASCRGHSGGWSEIPVVCVAIDEQRCRWIQPLVEAAGCGFHMSVGREDFLMIDAPSIRHMNQLAQAVLSRFNGRAELFDRWLDLEVIDNRYG
ncbi:hypothetical protein [Streptomyces sp. NPDC096012]|uniref:hypothetical protein n=1 Tax=Streptomyces sp. NPDC096012 TaxID=3155684 RepID=UPI00336A21ED